MDKFQASFLSLNVRDLNDNKKRHKIFSWCKKQNTDIVILQKRTIKQKSIGKDGVVFISILTESKLQLSLAHKYKLCCSISLFFSFLVMYCILLFFLKTNVMS